MNASTANAPKRGATTAKATWRHRFDRYRQHHRAVALDSLRRLVRAPLSTLMTWLVIAIALALPAGLFVLLKNAQAVSEGWEGGAQISLYMKASTSDADARAMVDEVAARVDVKRVDFISREKALADFQRQSGLGDILAGLDENPLPAVLVVYPDQADFAAADKLRSDLAKKEGVETAQLDAQWVQRLYAMLDLGERLVIALGTALALAVMLVIVNTVHLAIQSRRDEILIVKLVGATDAYVRRPFLYTGFWYGLGGSLLALVLVSAVLTWLDGPVNTLAALYHSSFRLAGLGVGPALLLILVAVLIGLGGAALAVRQHLREYEPR